MKKTYIGMRSGALTTVMVAVKDGSTYSLPMRLDIANHSPTGFEWGYEGSGPAQLALAILADHFGPGTGEKNPWSGILFGNVSYQVFKRDVISKLPASWRIESAEIEAWLEAIKPHEAI